MHTIFGFLLLSCLFVSLVRAQAPAAAAPTAEETARAAKFFAAQQRLRATDAKIKQAFDSVRIARETAREKSAAGVALRLQGRPKNADDRKAQADARKAEIDAEVQAETAQIALEEAELEQILKDDPSLAGLIAVQRADIAARKKTLAIRAHSAGRFEPDAAQRPAPPAGAPGGSK